ncbi:unnamed protein product [Paramecium sonneborni]|uniref:Uncharacterized protein n=1 Tax=Paramecium sonneborni TaxID=65129 RepID=A0A8S1NFR1_9CILI|nr:unnamed protein product [Paramecium sonneborni]
MINLIDLEGWLEYSTSPDINQLKQLSISPKITPIQRYKKDRLPSLQQKKVECNKINNYKSSYFVNSEQNRQQIINEERKYQKLTKKYTLIPQQQYQFHQLSSFIESPKKSQKIKELQDGFFSKRSYRIKIKNRTLNLTQKSPLLNISQLLCRLNSQDIQKNELLQILNK